MAKSKKKPEPANWVKGAHFRLEPEVLTQLDEIAAYHGEQLGVKLNRTNAVRIAARNEHRRIKGDGKK